MNRDAERSLVRLLLGEPPPDEAGRLEDRLAAEPELAAAYRRLEERWQSLELPPPAPAPAGFAGRVLARARALGRPQAGLGAAPLWVRATAALALALGIAGGAGLGVAGTSGGEDGLSDWGASLAESYWEAVEGDLDAGGLEGDLTGRGEVQR